MISSVENILDLNNHAVYCLREGDHSATASALRTAIRSLENCFQNAAKTCARPSCSALEPPLKRRRRTVGAAVSTLPPTLHKKSEEKSSYVPIRSISSKTSTSSLNEETALLMHYDKAFDFPSYDDNSIDLCSQRSKTRLAAILLYNLGLSHHRQGLRGGKSSDLHGALKFYREAYMVLKSAWAQSDFGEVFVLLLALLNNMACIHASMSDEKDTRQCIDWMNRAIASRQRAILCKDDYTFFSLNLSVWKGHQLRLASAA